MLGLGDLTAHRQTDRQPPPHTLKACKIRYLDRDFLERLSTLHESNTYCYCIRAFTALPLLSPPLHTLIKKKLPHYLQFSQRSLFLTKKVGHACHENETQGQTKSIQAMYPLTSEKEQQQSLRVLYSTTRHPSNPSTRTALRKSCKNHGDGLRYLLY